MWYKGEANTLLEWTFRLADNERGQSSEHGLQSPLSLILYPLASLAFSQFLNGPYSLDHRTFVYVASSAWKSLLLFLFLPS